MYAGEIVESGPTEQVLRDPRHPYTRALLAVASIGDWSRRTLEVIPGSPPEAGEELPGCRFAPRCRDAMADCTAEPVWLTTWPDENRSARCLRAEDLRERRRPTHDAPHLSCR